MTDIEQYCNTHHPQVDQLYNGRHISRHQVPVAIDVRRFIWTDDCIIESVLEHEIPNLHESQTHDQIAWTIQNWVCTGKRVQGPRTSMRVLDYQSDASARGHDEFWLFPAETLCLGFGDCEDGAILIASMLITAGIPAWRVRVAAGWVQEAPTAPLGGHAYCCYCRETDDQFVALDWCYYQDPDLAVADKPRLKTNSLYKDVWFSFNNIHAWAHTGWDMTGRAKDYEPSTRDCNGRLVCGTV